MLSRRNLLGAAVAVPALFSARHLWAAVQPQRSRIAGVQLGAQTYSYHDVLIDGGDHTDQVIAHLKANQLYSCELFSPQIEPTLMTGALPPKDICPKPDIGCLPGKGGTERNGFGWVFTRRTGEDLKAARAKAKAFRESKPTAYYESVRRRFNDAGIEIYSYNPMFSAGTDAAEFQMTDAEIDGVFYAAKVLGCRAINASIRKSMLPRVLPFAEKHQMIIAPHGHSNLSDADDFHTRKSFTDAFALSKWVWANLDIGHYTAAGEDPIEFIDAFHDRITNLHIKDRTRNTSRLVEDGANVVWGKGDTPIGPVLRLLRDKGYKIPAFIEIEHIGSTTAVGEVQIAYDYCKRELAKK